MNTFNLTNCLRCETDTNSLKVKPQSTFTAEHNTIKTNHKLQLHNIVMSDRESEVYKPHFLQMMTETFGFKLGQSADFKPL